MASSSDKQEGMGNPPGPLSYAEMSSSTVDPSIARQDALGEFLREYKINTWLEHAGERWVIRPGNHYKRSSPPTVQKSGKLWSSKREFDVVVLPAPKLLKLADFVSLELRQIKEIMRHTSELGGGWSLPREHRRHLLNLPQEILDAIFQYVLMTSECDATYPIAVTSNKCEVDAPSRPTFRINTHESNGTRLEDHRRISYSKGNDDEGEYTEIRSIEHPPVIDATCLRTCKQIYSFGSMILYGQNNFAFGLHSKRGRDCPSILIGRRVHNPNPEQPGPDSQWDREIPQAIMQVQYQVDIKNLPGWIYYDYFLRFLHIIGPQRSAQLKSLTFSGFVRTHDCAKWHVDPSQTEYYYPSQTEYYSCNNELVHTLRLYIPFIQKLCPNVETLTIHTIVKDLDRRENSDEEIIAFFEQRFKPLLETELRLLLRLRSLVVECKLKRIRHSYPFWRSRNIPVDFAKGAIDWFLARADRKVDDV